MLRGNNENNTDFTKTKFIDFSTIPARVGETSES